MIHGHLHCKPFVIHSKWGTLGFHTRSRWMTAILLYNKDQENQKVGECNIRYHIQAESQPFQCTSNVEHRTHIPIYQLCVCVLQSILPELVLKACSIVNTRYRLQSQGQKQLKPAMQLGLLKLCLGFVHLGWNQRMTLGHGKCTISCNQSLQETLLFLYTPSIRVGLSIYSSGHDCGKGFRPKQRC